MWRLLKEERKAEKNWVETRDSGRINYACKRGIELWNKDRTIKRMESTSDGMPVGRGIGDKG